MKNVIVSTLIVIMLAVGVCAFSALTVAQACGEMEEMRLEASGLCERGELQAALECVERMQARWTERGTVLAAVLPHSAVSEITAALIESKADLLAGEVDEFLGDMMLLRELLHHLEAEERLLLSNILSIC